MERLRALLKQQDRDLTELAAEVERKEITRDRIIRLMKIVQRNLEISERIVAILERTQGVALETTEEQAQGFRTKLH